MSSHSLIGRFGKLARDTREKGVSYVLSSRYAGLKLRAEMLRWILGGIGENFQFQGKSYRYFCHEYNRTWLNERAVEVPIIRDLLRGRAPEDVLEVGNVLGHYYRRRHQVLDKYEAADGVLNRDAAEFRPHKPYSLIISISTLEHVGWDERPRDPNKFRAAVDNLRRCLSPSGRLVFTVPLGYNPYMDDLILRGEIAQTAFMRRVSENNRWVEASAGELRTARYGSPFPYANAIAVGTVTP